MKNVVVASLILSAVAACLEAPDDPLGSTEEATTLYPGRCPDPADCSLLNGGGIYAEEGGQIGISYDNFMIERFVNKVNSLGGHYVGWEGRHQISPGHYGPASGQIMYAQYPPGDGISLQWVVTHIEENLTDLTFTLDYPDGPSQPFTVTGDELFNLRLITSTPETASFHRVTLYFDEAARPVPDTVPVHGSTHVVHQYSLYWYVQLIPWAHGPGTSYCQRAASADDYAVFQQGIRVDPMTAQTLFGQSSTVTVSCMGGAIATARSWGYPYRNISTDFQTLFEATMKMKRASYCGDETYYTTSGTPIVVNDKAGVNVNPQINNGNGSLVEARWGLKDGRVRAICVNSNHRRRPNVTYPESAGSEFLGTCYNDDGTTFSIPSCAGTTFDGVVVSDSPAGLVLSL